MNILTQSFIVTMRYEIDKSPTRSLTTRWITNPPPLSAFQFVGSCKRTKKKEKKKDKWVIGQTFTVRIG